MKSKFGKNKFGKKQKVVKGTSSAIVLSVLIHAGLFLLAGLLVVITVVNKPPPVFDEVTAVERPKMQLKKPRVRQKTKSKPTPPDRITATKGVAVLPEMDLPALGSMEDAVEFNIEMLDLEINFQPTELGEKESIGSDLVGTFYDLKFKRSGTFAPIRDGQMLYNYDSEFLLSGCDPAVLDQFYRSPNKLYATYICFPMQPSAFAPVAFGMPDDMASGGIWICHFEGKLVHKDGITFRFVGAADDGMAILVDGEIVLAKGQGSPGRGESIWKSGWQSTAANDFAWKINGRTASIGDWITLEPGVPKDIDIVLCDNNARNAQFVLCVQEKGVDYPNNWRGEPLLPIFKMDHLSHDQLDIIYKNFAENEVDFINGPVFREY